MNKKEERINNLNEEKSDNPAANVSDELSAAEIDELFNTFHLSNIDEAAAEAAAIAETEELLASKSVSEAVAAALSEEVIEAETETTDVSEVSEESASDSGLPNDLNDTATPSEAEEARELSFDESLDAFTPEDTCSGKEPYTKKFDVIRLGVLAVCLFALVYSSYILITNIREKAKSDLIYNEINNAIDFNIPGQAETESGIVSLLAPDNPSAMTPTMDEIIKNGAVEIITPGSHAAELAQVRASLEHLKNINDDLFGFIKIPGTNISYPIAKHESDNDYYLDRAYNGEHLVNGSIFADVRCNNDVMWNYNTVLFGHNVTSGSMFNHVNKFFDKEFFDNTLIYLYTFDGIFIYKPFSIHETEYDSGYIAMAFSETDHFVQFANKMRDESDVKSDATFTASSRMLTLSTCTNTMYTRRYALHAYLVDSITD